MLDYQINKVIQESYGKICHKNGGCRDGMKKNGKRFVRAKRLLNEDSDNTSMPNVKDDSYYARERQHGRYGDVHKEIHSMFGDTAKKYQDYYNQPRDNTKSQLENPYKVLRIEKPIDVKFKWTGNGDKYKDVTDYPKDVKTDVYGKTLPPKLSKENVVDVAKTYGPTVLGMAKAKKAPSKLMAMAKGLGSAIGSGLGFAAGYDLYDRLRNNNDDSTSNSNVMVDDEEQYVDNEDNEDNEDTVTTVADEEKAVNDFIENDDISDIFD